MALFPNGDERMFDTSSGEGFLGSLKKAAVLTMNLNLIGLGDELGFFDHLRDPQTPTTLATKCGCAERYVKEWCLAMGAAGVLKYEDEKYSIPRDVDVSKTGLLFATFPFVIQHRRKALIECYKTGTGISWQDRGSELQGCFCTLFQPVYEEHLVPSIPATTRTRLEKTGAAAADVGCGYGITSKLLAEAFPKATIQGFDYDAPSIAAATKNHAHIPNLSFHVASAELIHGGPYDVVFFFDCFHDMAVATKAAVHAKTILKPGGIVLLIEPMGADTDDPDAQFALATATFLTPCSCTCCLPCGMCNNGDGLGTVCPTAKYIDIFINHANFDDLIVIPSPINNHGLRLIIASLAD